MAKEKVRAEKTGKRDYFYELSATLAIIISLVVLSELGLVGVVLKTFVKILMGDFYWILLLFILAHGFYALLKHKWFDKTSIRFNGFILFFVILMTLSHIGFYDSLNVNSGNLLPKTFQIYQSSIQNKINLKTYGGGLIGAIILQVFIVLFQRTGAIIICLFLLFLSISFMTNISIKSILFRTKDTMKKLRGSIVKFVHYFSNIRYPNRGYDKKKQLEIHMNLLNDVDNTANEVLQTKLAYEQKSELLTLFQEHGITVTQHAMQVGYSTTRYLFHGEFSSYQDSLVEKRLHAAPISYQMQQQLAVEVPNRLKRLLTLKRLLMDQSHPNYDIPIGIEINDEVTFFEPLKTKHLLLSGGYDSGIKTWIQCFIVSLIYRLKSHFKLAIFDGKEEFSELKYFPNHFIPYCQQLDKLSYMIDELVVELERRLAILNEASVLDYLQMNEELKKQNMEEFVPIFCIINHFDLMKGNFQALDTKLLYFLKFGHKAGIHMIILNRTSGLSKVLISNIPSRLVFKCYSIDQSYEILGNKNACLLDKKGDFIMIHQTKIYHCQGAYLSPQDYRTIINKFVSF